MNFEVKCNLLSGIVKKFTVFMVLSIKYTLCFKDIHFLNDEIKNKQENTFPFT